MNVDLGKVILVGIAFSLILVGASLSDVQDSETDGSHDRRVTTCEELENHNFERMLSRVERLKGTEMSLNVSICSERYERGIQTVPTGNRFARIEPAGLKFFELNDTTRTSDRSSIGHILFTPGGNHVDIILANESIVKNVSWISYEGVVAHEMSDAIYAASLSERANRTNGQQQVHLTTDYALAQQAYSNGISMYVAELYVKNYGGHLNVTALKEDDSNWKHQIMKSMYFMGYKYASSKGIRRHSFANQTTTTAQLLHPERTDTGTQLLERPTLSMRGVKHTRTDTVGEFFIKEILRVHGINSQVATQAADGWDADRMDYYRTSEGTLVSWRIVWRNKSERQEFLSAYDTVYEFSMVDSVNAVDCTNSGRFLTARKNVVTIIQCPS